MIKPHTNMKVMTLFGTRPEIIRLSRVMAALDKHLLHIMVHTGQSYDYEMSKIFFEQLEIRKPDYFLDVKADTFGAQIANIIARSEEVFLKEKPDALLILGDTNSSLACIVAKRLKIPIFHMEAGNRCFDTIPEEINRKIVDHISDINLPYSENARLNLLAEGIHPNGIFVTGSPLREVLDYFRPKIEQSKVHSQLDLDERTYFLASIHREENVDSKESLGLLLQALGTLASSNGFPVIVSTHPRTSRRIKEFSLSMPKNVKFCKPFGYFEYMRLQQLAACVLSDSGTILEESSLLPCPAVQVRSSSERPEAYDEGVSILTGLNTDSIIKSVEIVMKEWQEGKRPRIPTVYQAENVSSKVLRHIVGLTNILRSKQ